MDGGQNITLADIRVGRVFMMNPGSLLGIGANVLASEKVNILGGHSPHYFVCIGVNGNKSYWVPLSSAHKPNGSPSQGTITSDQKIGYPQFKQNDSWYDLEQIWEIENRWVIHYAGHYENINRTNNNTGLRNEVFLYVVNNIFAEPKLGLGV